MPLKTSLKPVQAPFASLLGLIIPPTRSHKSLLKVSKFPLLGLIIPPSAGRTTAALQATKAELETAQTERDAALERLRQTVRQMKADGMAAEAISKYTGMSAEEISKVG